MIHTKRRWMVSIVDSPQTLAEMLTKRTWTLCSGFAVAGYEDYLFLNDAFHEDGAQEYAVLTGGVAAATHCQIESITFSWCEPAQAREYIEDVLRGDYDNQLLVRDLVLHTESVRDHDRCPLCE